MVPAAVAACSVTVPAPQRDAPVVDVKEGIVFTVATTAVLELDVHPLLLTSA